MNFSFKKFGDLVLIAGTIWLLAVVPGMAIGLIAADTMSPWLLTTIRVSLYFVGFLNGILTARMFVPPKQLELIELLKTQNIAQQALLDSALAAMQQINERGNQSFTNFLDDYFEDSPITNYFVTSRGGKPILKIGDDEHLVEIDLTTIGQDSEADLLSALDRAKREWETR
jgi:hypothetical protein